MELKTEHQKLNEYIHSLEFILHPKLLIAFQRQLNACFEESKSEAYKIANISTEAKQLDREIRELKAQIEKLKDVQDPETLRVFHIKCFYKSLLKRYNVCGD